MVLLRVAIRAIFTSFILYVRYETGYPISEFLDIVRKEIRGITKEQLVFYFFLFFLISDFGWSYWNWNRFISFENVFTLYVSYIIFQVQENLGNTFSKSFNMHVKSKKSGFKRSINRQVGPSLLVEFLASFFYRQRASKQRVSIVILCGCWLSLLGNSISSFQRSKK